MGTDGEGCACGKGIEFLPHSAVPVCVCVCDVDAGECLCVLRMSQVDGGIVFSGYAVGRVSGGGGVSVPLGWMSNSREDLSVECRFMVGLVLCCFAV